MEMKEQPFERNERLVYLPPSVNALYSFIG
jgi:hypothetical protein